MRRGTALRSVLALFVVLPACGGCDEDRMSKESTRLWGRDKVAAKIEAQAKERLDAHALDDRPDVKQRVLSMPFAEVVARLGFLSYQGTARFDLTRNQGDLRVYEKTTIQHGLHGSFRVLQKDEDDAVLRETVFNNGVYYVRNGPGKLRVQGVLRKEHMATRDEAYEPLSTFTAYYGPRLGLAEAGAATVDGRPAVKYDLVLLEGSELVEVPGMKGKKRPVSLEGHVLIDEATAAPVGAKLDGVLEIPAPEEGQKPGRLALHLDFVIETNEGAEIKPGEFVPTIKSRKVDLDPLAFLDGGTRTSTVIGGKGSAEDE